ncbi:ATP-grasp domain-containing protein [Streptomyces cavernicola]|uniref:ATP-grasp domain-containing protein n=1 Tax=Streptomyces cavernicola TaxID=3043613 RepID=A0ABT6SKE3_9ACTN|nr:hypothetical protein [Streptomyces sp. B-S-A6]MDI3408658.1 hypothetical protein [Streptomyces sp. B-S-A6]
MTTAARPRLLYVTDLAYEARGRRYCDEDIFLTSRLRADFGFDLALCHPADAAALMDSFDLVVIRNSGPVINYLAAYEEFRARALASGTPVYNPLHGRADMAGKQYLLDLTAAGFPVIPTVDRAAHLDRLPEAAEYVVKPSLGADSIGLRVLPRAELASALGDTGSESESGSGLLAQPRIPFSYEVSFYFVDDDFQYALRTSDGGERWKLQPYEPTDADLEFARRFVAWNTLDHGIQRVDACRAPDGELLLVELEDLNPYLSLDLLDSEVRERFVGRMARSLRECLAAAATARTR